MQVKFGRQVLAVLVMSHYMGPAHAAGEASAPIISTISALMLVLVAIGVAAFLMKRFVPGVSSRAGVMRVVSQLTVGTHERVSVVEINGQWLVLGVTAHQVNLITQMPALPEPEGAAPPASFGNLFSNLKGKRDAS